MSAQEKAAGMLEISEAAQETLRTDFTPEIKATATVIAQFALAGHAVHKGSAQDFIVCKFGMTRHCKDFAALQAFAKQVGVN